MPPAILTVEGLHVDFRTFDGSAQVLDGVSLRVEKGQRVGLVGESGCGKSVTMRAIMGTLATPPAIIARGHIAFEENDLLAMPATKRNELKGSEMSMVFQDPMTSLNPVFRIGEQLHDIVKWSDRRRGRKRGNRERHERVLEVLAQVRLPDPPRIYDAYPVQLSGGMRQRVLIAMALLNRPRFLIADEPGTALDVTTQDEILNLLNELVVEGELSLLIISHNLGVVRGMTDHLYVMYAGQVVEEGPTGQIMANPQHPYTRALFACVPKLSGDADYAGIAGTLPDYTEPPAGCRFHPRCPHAMPVCRTRPPEFELGGGHKSTCWLHESADVTSEAAS
jgi:oligopeptide/dipeptide ABC transporter ATP-binding protein